MVSYSEGKLLTICWKGICIPDFTKAVKSSPRYAVQFFMQASAERRPYQDKTKDRGKEQVRKIQRLGLR
jgi:hypothetical protein